MTSEEANTAIKYHTSEIEKHKLELEKLFIIINIALEKENGQISIDELESL